jgi:hypothetical protein
MSQILASINLGWSLGGENFVKTRHQIYPVFVLRINCKVKIMDHQPVCKCYLQTNNVLQIRVSISSGSWQMGWENIKLKIII